MSRSVARLDPLTRLARLARLALRTAPSVAVALGSVFLGACSGASSPARTNDGIGASDDSGVAADGATAAPRDSSVADTSKGPGPAPDAGPGTDATTLLDAPSGDTEPTQEEDSGDGATIATGPGVPNPAPPAGATACGSGTITQAAAAMDCMTPDLFLDSMPLPDGGIQVTARACSAVTTTGGTWQAWCSPSSVYVYAVFDGLSNTGTLADCHGGSILLVEEGVFSAGNYGGNGVEILTYDSNGDEIAGLVPGTPETLLASATLPVAGASGGTADFFVLGGLEDSCKMGATDPFEVLLGFSVKWN